ncbi:MAG: hypothetical protein NTY20_03415 [Candidatus Aenigmarchaeota archaeon]|nr:hypothetical protein [Candidatus Aenigmarchaeota archaeon]
MGCLFSRKLRESLRSSLENPDKASECVCLQYIDEGFEGVYLVCSCLEKIETCNCAIKREYLHKAVENYRPGKRI